jgi:uncharacterized membrane protein YbjE (DUF340 family)
MIRFLLMSATGWVAVLAIGIEIALPYLIRNSAQSSNVTSRGATTLLNRRSLRTRMWPHYWLGYALVALAMTHTSFVMGPAMGRSDPTGIWAATLALFILLLQVGVGLLLKSGVNDQRKLRRWHFWSMVALVGFVLTHLLRNG